MSTLRRWCCAVLGCVTPPGVTRHLSIYFYCARCSRVVPGALSITRRR